MDNKLDNDPLIQKDCVKYLGIFIDSKLSWENHIDHVKKKLSSGLAIIFKLRHYLSQNQLKDLYFAFIHSNILYGLEIWGAANKTKLDAISKLMNKSLRAMYFKGKDDEIKP